MVHGGLKRRCVSIYSCIFIQYLTYSDTIITRIQTEDTTQVVPAFKYYFEPIVRISRLHLALINQHVVPSPERCKGMSNDSPLSLAGTWGLDRNGRWEMIRQVLWDFKLGAQLRESSSHPSPSPRSMERSWLNRNIWASKLLSMNLKTHIM